jgi:hypothetical protein
MGVRIAFALIGSALWTAVAAFHVHEAWPALAELKVNQLTDLLARQGAELAFFWLVLGYIWLVTAYFQQRADLRQSVTLIERITERAEEAAAKAEVESRKIQQYQTDHIRSAQPLWQIQGRIAHRDQHEINLLNTGAAASSIRAMWHEELPLVVAVSNSTVVNRGEQLTLKVMFRDAPLEQFDVMLEYRDGIRETRRACIAVSETAVAITHEDC